MRFVDDGRLEQVAAVLREDLAAARLADPVAGASDALHAARDRTGRLDLDDEIDRAHVDAELEGRRRDEAAQSSRLRVVLDDQPLLARQRSVVRLGDLGSVISAASSFSRAASRSAIRRALTNTIVEWCSCTSSRIFGWIAGQIERRVP